MDLAGAGGDNAEVGASSDGIVGGGLDSSAGEEGGGVLEVEHLAAEFIRNGIDKDKLVGEILSEDGLGYGHSHVARSNNGDFGVALCGRRRCSVHDGLEEGLS